MIAFFIKYAILKTDIILFRQHRCTALQGKDHDRFGNVTAIRYFGGEKQPILYEEAYHEVQYAYDENGNCIHSVYCGIDGTPIRQKDGYAITEYAYDQAPARCQGLFHEARIYDENGDRTRYQIYDIDGTLLKE